MSQNAKTKKVTKKKVTKNKTEDGKLFATEEEKLRFLNGVYQQNLCNEKLSGAQLSLELLVLSYNTKVISAKSNITQLEENRKVVIRNYNRDMDRIKERLGFEGGFGINPDTNEVIPHPTKKTSET